MQSNLCKKYDVSCDKKTHYNQMPHILLAVICLLLTTFAFFLVKHVLERRFYYMAMHTEGHDPATVRVSTFSDERFRSN